MKQKLLLTLLLSLIFSSVQSQENKTKIDNDKLKAIEKEKKEYRKQMDGSTLTELSFTDIDGREYTLNSLKGKIIVFNFWFIQCKPCVEEFPDLNELKKAFKDQPVEFFAVSWNRKDSLEKFLKTNQLDYTVVPDKKLIEKFQIQYYPYNIIIDQNGKVEYVNEALSLNIFKKIERKIKKLL